MSDNTDSFNDLIQDIVDEYVEDDLKGFAKYLKEKEPTVYANFSKHGLVVGYEMLSTFANLNNHNLDSKDSDNQPVNIIDLKPYFEHSSKVKYTKNGDWYLIVPVGGQHYTPLMRSAYSRRLWDKISAVGSGTYRVDDPQLVQRVQNKLGASQNGVIPELQYAWKSANVTRVPYGSGKRGHYLTFRTVSDKSDPNSWVIGRQYSQQLAEKSFNILDNTEDLHSLDSLTKVISNTVNSYLDMYRFKKAKDGDYQWL